MRAPSWKQAALILISTAGLSACAPKSETERSGQETAAINGTAKIDANCGAATPNLFAAMQIVSTELLTDASTYDQCFEDAFLSMNKGDSPETIETLLRQDKITDISCGNAAEVCHVPNALACARLGLAGEALFIDLNTATGAPPSFIAGVIVHEVAHNKDYSHPLATEYEYDYTVPQQARACITPQSPNHARRSLIPGETELAQVGERGGEPFENACPAEMYMTALDVGWDNLIRNFQPLCLRTDGAIVEFGARTGNGSSGNVSDLACAGDEAIVGIHGQSGNVVNALGVTCAKLVDLVEKQATTRLVGSIGGGGGTPFARQCPLGMAVKRIFGRSGAAIDQLRIVCEDITVAEQGEPHRQGSVIGSSNGYDDEEHCSGFGAMVGLYGEADNSLHGRVHRLGGICQPVAFSIAPGDLAPNWPLEHATRALEGGSSNAFTMRCPLGSMVVGLDASAGARVDNINAICGTISRWKVGTPVVFGTDYFLVTSFGVGGGGGTHHREVCPVGEYVVGFESFDGDDDGVFGVLPICRALEADRVPPPLPLIDLTVETIGLGSITSIPLGISCGTLCDASFPVLSEVELLPQPEPGWVFTGWGGACSGDGLCTVTMDEVKAVSATFDLAPSTDRTLVLTLVADPECEPPGGTVSATLPGLNCVIETAATATCTGEFPDGTELRLNATPDAFTEFEGFTGSACMTSLPTCGLELDSDATVTATFCGIIP